MRRLLVFLFLLSLAFCSFGSSKVEVIRTWQLTGNSSTANFEGMLVLNNSHQHLVEMELQPPLKLKADGEKLLVVYSGPLNGTQNFSARAVVAIDYDTAITADEQLPLQPINGSNLVLWNKEIQDAAHVLVVDDSSLRTTEAIADWVGKTMTYDISYFGLTKSARDVIRERTGVCVEYTHLLISMLNSLGLQTRYVSGYVWAGELSQWQPHAWAEVYSNGQWVPVDATFQEAGILDDSHVAISYGEDADSLYDKLTAYGSPSIDSTTQCSLLEESVNDKGANVSLSFNDATDTLTVYVTNNRNEYVFGSYELTLPEQYGGDRKRILLLGPLQVYNESVAFPAESFQEGFVYTIPARASFNDASAMKNIVVEKEAAQQPVNPEKPACGSVFVFAFISAGAFFLISRNYNRF
jgi:hypothetical protein